MNNKKKVNEKFIKQNNENYTKIYTYVYLTRKKIKKL